MSYILAVDCGTTSVRAMLYNVSANKFEGSSALPLAQTYPHPAWVEQDANELYANTIAAIISRLDAAPDIAEVAGIGITNQRETVIAWDRRSGKPICNAIVWQCRRTADFCKSISGEAESISYKTGLVIDPYFSASKMRWILDNVPEARRLADRGNLCLGTVDSYLIFRLTEGKRFVTDMTNASRTMLYNIRTHRWDDELCKLFGVPMECLPEVRSSAEVLGHFNYCSRNIPIAGLAGDQQSALFGQGCLSAGKGKITYGTGMFMLLSTGERISSSKCGMITTVAASYGGKVSYALEGSVFNAGSCVQWLRDELGLISSSAESEELAVKVKDSGGVYFVPAFTGLGAPYWDSAARASFTGISRGTNKYHLVRAVLESIAFSAKDLAENMCADSGIEISEIGVDGGASSNDFLMQFQSDVLGVRLVRPSERESTALGAAYLAGLALGLIDEKEIAGLKVPERIFKPSPNREHFRELYDGYRRAVLKTIG